MTSVFTIHPRDGTDVVCTLGDTDNVPYVVIDLDFNESRREQIAYSEGTEGGSVQSVSHDTAQASITIAILGSDEASVAARVRTISRAFRWLEGGTIEFKPAPYPSSTQHTYYHYLRSAPPVKVAGKAASLGGSFQYGEVFRFDVQIEAWATSNPDSLATLVSATDIDNRNDTTGTNYLSALSSNMKGDAFIPHIKMRPKTAAFKTTILYLHILEVPPGTTDPNDTWRFELWTAEASETNAADATAWDGTTRRTTTASLSLSDGFETVFSGITWKKYNFGKVSFIFRARVGDVSTTWDVKFRIIESQNIASEFELSATGLTTVDNDDWTIFDTTMLDLPPFDTPERLGDSGSPTFGDWVANNLSLRVTGDRTAGTGVLDMDALMVVNADKFLAKYIVASGLGGGNLPIITSAVENASYKAASDVSDNLHDVAWNKFGPPLNDMIMHKGKDYIIRVMADSTIFGFLETETIEVQVLGLHATIYPFEVS